MKIVLGFSGGVDSSVCAELLKRGGRDVYGLYLDIAGDDARQCAIETAECIGIPLKVLDISCELEECVCKSFEASYLRGETPNPCIICNPAVKFRSLIDYADSIGADSIATGHYARAEDGFLYKGLPANDQSYMLCRLTEAQLKRTVFPLGAYEKQQVRALAAEMKLPVANKPDSMEICFIPDRDYVSWLSKRSVLPGEGDFVFHGEPLGKHSGICSYTVGQRRPGLFDGRKLYISGINPDDNTVELALWEELFKTKVVARCFNWINGAPDKPLRARVRVRHTKWEMPECTAVFDGEYVVIECDEPVRAPAPGQSAVLYDGEKVLGGGFIV